LAGCRDQRRDRIRDDLIGAPGLCHRVGRGWLRIDGWQLRTAELNQLALRRSSGRLAAGISIPLVIAVVAYGLAWTSDQVESIGPLDRATFFWAVATPLWLMSPIVGGFIWRRLTLRQVKLAAAAVGVISGAATALLFWQWIGVPQDCGFGTVTPVINYLPQALIVGVLVGASLALTGLLVSWLFHTGVRWWAVVVGVGLELVLLGLGYAFGVAVIIFHGCSGAAPPV
jgi:hypothetical protein